jgi:hypothetical protein
MDSNVTVINAAASQDLTTLATVKTIMGITGSAQDALISLLIPMGSNEVASFCNRVLGQETVSQRFFLNWHDRPEILQLDRFPVASIASVTEGDQVLSASDYLLDAPNGRLRRLSSDVQTCWSSQKIVVEYVGGYALLGELPNAIETACIKRVSMLLHEAGRDPSVRQISIPGVIERSYWVGAEASDPVIKDIERMLNPFRKQSC